MATRSARIPIVVLAAGSSTRFGSSDKLVAPVAGRALLAWTLDALPREVRRIVVTGAGSGSPALLALSHGCEIAVAHDAVRGMRHSVLAGLEAAGADPDTRGAIIVLGDDPLAARSAMSVLGTASADPDRAVAVRRPVPVPHPVYVPRAAWPDRSVLDHGHDHGLRDLVVAGDVTWLDGSAAATLDVDQPADVAELARLLAQSPAAPAT